MRPDIEGEGGSYHRFARSARGGGRPPRQCVPVDASVTGAFAVWEPRERCLGKHQELDALGPGTLDVLEVLVQIRLGRAEASVDLGDPDA